MKEKDLIAKFLVGNELYDSVTLQQFKTLFPASAQSHPEVKHLYRAYLNARHQVRTKVRRNIDIEVKRNPFNLNIPQESGVGIRGSIETSESHDVDSTMLSTDDMDIEVGSTPSYTSNAVYQARHSSRSPCSQDTDKYLTLDQAIQELAQAERIYKSEIEMLEKECNEFAQEFEE